MRKEEKGPVPRELDSERHPQAGGHFVHRARTYPRRLATGFRGGAAFPGFFSMRETVHRRLSAGKRKRVRIAFTESNSNTQLQILIFVLLQSIHH